MKTLSTKLTIASLTAIALCIAGPIAAQSQQPAKTDAQPAQPAAEAAAQTENAQQPAAAKNAEKTQPASETKAGERAATDSQQPTAQTAASATPAQNATASAEQKSPAPEAAAGQSKKTEVAQHATTTAPAPATPAVPARPLRIASKDMKDQTAEKLAGSTVRGSDGKRLGKVKDFLVDAESGNVTFAVVTSGGALGIGDELRLVPFTALRRTGSDHKFGLDLTEAQWKQLATVDENATENPSITFSDAQRRRLEQAFAPGKADTGSSYYTAGISEHLVSARSLEGRKVRSGNGGAGTIEGVVIDVSSRQATALFDPRRGFLGSSQKFLVPLEQLSISGDKRPQITMALTADDFRATQTGKPAASGESQVASAQQPAANTKIAAAPSKAPASGTIPQPPAPSANQNQSNQLPASSVAANTAKSSPQPESQSGTTTNTQKKQVASTETSTPAKETSAGDEQLTATGRDTASKQAVAKSDEATKAKSQSDEAKPAVTSTPESQDIAAAAPKKKSSSDTTANQAATASPQSKMAANESAGAKDKASSAPANTTGKPAEKLASATSSPSAVREDQPDSSDKQTGKSTNVAANDEHPRTPPTVDAKSPAQTMPTPQSTPSRSEDLSPTGKTSADQTPEAEPALIEAARAVRKALDDDPEVARADVRVMPENKKLMLRGSVKSEDEKQTIEQLAKKAAQGHDIQSEISVGTK